MSTLRTRSGPLQDVGTLGLVTPLRLGRRRWAALVGGAVVVAATGALASPGLPTSAPALAGAALGAASTAPLMGGAPMGAAPMGSEASALVADAATLEPMATKLQHSRVLPYPSDRVWPTTIRYLRVDRGFAIVDRDRDAGFILFEFAVGSDEGAKGRGSVELVETADPSGRPAVKLQISTDAGPLHLPHALADGLAAKLKAEHGQPAPPPPSAPPSPTPPSSPAPEAPEDSGLWVPEDPAQ